jgi:hypothetical protein
MDDTAYYLSAVIGHKPGSLEVRTTTFSSANLEALLEEQPAAIAVAPEGELAAERFLEAFRAREPMLQIQYPRRRTEQAHRWRYYSRRLDEHTPHLVRSIDSYTLRIQILKPEVRKRFELLTFVREDISGEALSPSSIDCMIVEVMKPPRARRQEMSSEQLESDNRDGLRRTREAMLERIETYNSTQLASACDSLNVNPSQFAADMRKANRIFAVRFGRDWRYPRFQFNQGVKPLAPFPEMRDVLAALAPDKRGWDRLQWFLDPNPALNGRIPWDVWREDRSKVVQAARAEQWDVRD